MLVGFRTDLSGIQNMYLSLVSWMKIPQFKLLKPFIRFFVSLNTTTMYSKFLSFVIFVSAVVAVPTILPRNQTCDSGPILCCNELEENPSQEPNCGSPSSLIGLNCIPIAGQGGAGVDWSVVRLIYKQICAHRFLVTRRLYAAQTLHSVLFSFFLSCSIIHSLPHRRVCRTWLRAC